MSTYGTTRHQPAALTSKDRVTDYQTTLFRRLTWDGTVPLEIRVDPKELPANSERGLECYFIQAPRVSYLPLLMPEIRQFFMGLVFDEVSAKELKDDQWWFETAEGVLLKWHWPIGLIYDNHTISCSLKASSSRPSSVVEPLRLILHLASPPTERLLLSPSIEACKQAFMGQLKEADFMRWGSTRRMTGLRKQEQDGIWEGIKEHNFDDYWRVAVKITPSSSMRQSAGPPQTSTSMHHRPPSADPGGPVSEKDGAYSVRSVPVRLYLPDGPVIQDLVPPYVADETPHTLNHYLAKHLPLLFPPLKAGSQPERALAFAVIQGIEPPLESELAWLGACLAGADGWLSVCIGIHVN